MEIFPQNLSSRYHIELVRRRSAKGFGEPRVDEPLPKPDLGRLGRFWAHGINLTKEQAALAAPASETGTKSLGAVTMIIGTVFAGMASLALGEIFHSPALGFSAFGATTTGLWLLGYGGGASMSFVRPTRLLVPKKLRT